MSLVFPLRTTSDVFGLCSGLSPSSEIRAEVHMGGKFPWTKNRQASGIINLQALFNDYWISDEHEFTVQGQS